MVVAEIELPYPWGTIGAIGMPANDADSVGFLAGVIAAGERVVEEASAIRAECGLILNFSSTAAACCSCLLILSHGLLPTGG